MDDICGQDQVVGLRLDSLLEWVVENLKDSESNVRRIRKPMFSPGEEAIRNVGECIDLV